jgi:hypothetical protein
MELRLCKCGCGTEMPSTNKWEYIRGHKPAELSHKKKPGKGTTALAKRERPIVIDQQLEDEAPVYVTCEISVPQLDKIYNLLPAAQRGTAVLAGVEDLD